LKTRLDVLLTEQGYFATREKAKAAVMAGLVFVDGQLCDKAGTGISEKSTILVKGSDCPFVSRGGLKLAKALEVFSLSVKDFTCIDIGASTGGFTDCLLQNGAKKVYALDVGYGQLDYKLRIDQRVINMEKENFRYMTKEKISEDLDFACTDVSFISLKHIFPPAALLLKNHANMVALIKPQFEAGREQVGNGIIKDAKIHESVIKNVFSYALESGFSVKDLNYSPVKGAKGNIEFLLLLEKDEACKINEYIDIEKTVQKAHESLNTEK